MLLPRTWSYLLCALLMAAVCASASAAVPEKISFNQHVRPILSNNCFYCHGPDPRHREAELRLDQVEAATADRGGDAAIVPGKPDASLLIQRVTSHDPDELMPPPSSKRPKLSAEQIAILRRWIEQGAKYEGHWSFIPLAKSPPPAVKNEAWISNPIDRFILARLEQEGIKPSPAADPATFIRRVSLDLTGLLPTPDEVDAFQQSAIRNPQSAIDSLVDRLLASPHYGERWGRHWLDQARYADSNGYSVDSERAMWPFRDWVIQALNDDLPFDQFTIEQLAGDLLPDPTKAQLVATAFHRNTLINEEGGVDAKQFRHEAVVDRVNTTAAVWLGLTVACAQCHSHKFDPISQREYYELFAFFNNTTDVNNKGATMSVARGEMLRGTVTTSTQSSSADTDEQAVAPSSEAPARKGRQGGGGAAEVMVMKELDKPRETFLCVRGDFLRPDKELGPLMANVPAAVAPKLLAAEKRTRLDLARWLVSPENPLTPRVAMNRLWMHYFGRGLVETEEDFGTQGTPPTHPELLDWLAAEFIRSGWSLKHMHRLIVTSSTYRQSSSARPDLAEQDPRNLLLARQERLRVDAEIVRDAALSASGQLDPTIGGPSVRPPQPDGVYAFTQTAKRWTPETGAARYRRGMYTLFYRSAPYPLFTTFDTPDFQTVCTRRIRSNTPLQALTVANDQAFVEIAEGLAARVVKELPAADPPARLRLAFGLCLCREPGQRELTALESYYDRQLARFTNDPARAKTILPSDFPDTDVPASAALVLASRAILNTDSFITRE